MSDNTITSKDKEANIEITKDILHYRGCCAPKGTQLA
jgi:hypothetical protein